MGMCACVCTTTHVRSVGEDAQENIKVGEPAAAAATAAGMLTAACI